MQRIERRLREAEAMMLFLLDHPETPESVREGLMPVISAHLETINQWRLMRLAGKVLPSGEQRTG